MIEIYHTTSTENALSILINGFAIDRRMLLQDQVANFHDNNHTHNQFKYEGCTMLFQWRGGEAVDFTGQSVADMRANIIYLQKWSEIGGFWRYALRPGTNQNLVFIDASIGDEFAISKILRRNNRVLNKYNGKSINVNWK